MKNLELCGATHLTCEGPHIEGECKFATCKQLKGHVRWHLDHPFAWWDDQETTTRSPDLIALCLCGIPMANKNMTEQDRKRECHCGETRRQVFGEWSVTTSTSKNKIDARGEASGPEPKEKTPMKIFETFLKIPTQSDTPELDGEWLAARGIDPLSPVVLRLLREKIMPISIWCEKISILVHDYASGVPTTPDDKACYLHIRFTPSDNMSAKSLAWLTPEFVMTREVDQPEKIAGFEGFTSAQIERVWELLYKQTDLLLDFLDMHEKSTDDLTLVKHTRQFLHFFANMSQMKIF